MSFNLFLYKKKGWTLGVAECGRTLCRLRSFQMIFVKKLQNLAKVSTPIDGGSSAEHLDTNYCKVGPLFRH